MENNPIKIIEVPGKRPGFFLLNFTRTVNRILFISFIALLLTSCSREIQSTRTKKAIPLSYAQNFKLDSLENGVLLTIGESKGRIKRFLLAAEKPAHLINGALWIKTPVSRLVAFAGTDIGMLTRLDAADHICGVSDRTLVFSSAVRNHIRKNRTLDFRQEAQVSFEQLLQCKPNLITYSDFGKDYPHEEALGKAGVICLPILDWKEQHPLGKAEWLKVYGYLCGKEKEANQAFNNSVETYNTLKKGISSKGKPTVFSGNQTGEIWFCPAGNSYEAKLISDAGGDYTYKKTKGTGSLSLTPEKVLTDNRHTAIWINPEANNIRELLQKQGRSAFFDAYASHKIYCYSGNMNKYWETAACYPEKVLEDLITIFHTKNPTGLNYYQRLK